MHFTVFVKNSCMLLFFLFKSVWNIKVHILALFHTFVVKIAVLVDNKNRNKAIETCSSFFSSPRFWSVRYAGGRLMSRDGRCQSCILTTAPQSTVNSAEQGSAVECIWVDATNQRITGFSALSLVVTLLSPWITVQYSRQGGYGAWHSQYVSINTALMCVLGHVMCRVSVTL